MAIWMPEVNSTPWYTFKSFVKILLYLCVAVSCSSQLCLCIDYCIAVLQGSELEVQFVALSCGRMIIIYISVTQLIFSEVWMKLSISYFTASTLRGVVVLVLVLVHGLLYWIRHCNEVYFRCSALGWVAMKIIDISVASSMNGAFPVRDWAWIEYTL